MAIDHRTIFIGAWKSARRMRGQYRILRTAFAAALRRVWSLVKAMAVEEAQVTVVHGSALHTPAQDLLVQNGHHQEAVCP